MKTKKYILRFFGLVLIGVIILGGCTKLEDESYTDIFAEGYNFTDEDIQVTVAAAYGDWRKILLYWNGYWRAQEVGADQILIPARPNGWVDGGEFRRMHEHTWVENDPNVDVTWSRTYTGIESTNKIINDIESGVMPFEGEARAKALAQLKVLRASYYYVLCDLYGNVPIVTKSAFYLEEGYLPEQSSRAEVYQWIVDEIEDNIDYLPRERIAANYGRWTYYAANTLLAKIYLNAEVYSGTAQWKKCIAICDTVLNNNQGYALEADQKAVFATENETSAEIIFGLSIEPSLLDVYGSEWNAFDLHMQTLQPVQQSTYNLTRAPWGGMCAIPQFIDSFDPDDTRLTRNYIYGQQYDADGQPLNAGLGVYSGQPLIYINEVPGVDSSQAIHGYRLGKFEIAMGSTNVLANDYPLLRMADVYMMKAECLLRTGNADDAAVLVTKIRERAFKTAPEKATVTGAELMEGSAYDYGRRDYKVTTSEGGDDIQYGRFLDELAWEFNQEGRRRQDMIRFGVYTTKSFLSHEPNGDYRILYPIPRSELDKNANLTQNPGY